jgi:hypothetical protein
MEDEEGMTVESVFDERSAREDANYRRGYVDGREAGDSDWAIYLTNELGESIQHPYHVVCLIRKLEFEMNRIHEK